MKFTKQIGKEAFFEFILFCLSIGAISLFYHENFLLALWLIALSIIVLKFWYKEHDSYFYIVGALIGSIAEITSISFGVWSYTFPVIFNIPPWLPFTWGFCVVMMRKVVDTLIEIK